MSRRFESHRLALSVSVSAVLVRTKDGDWGIQSGLDNCPTCVPPVVAVAVVAAVGVSSLLLFVSERVTI